METKHILLTKELRKEFSSVCPLVFKDQDTRISIGAYQPDGGILGAMSFVLVDNQYDVEWLYVIPEARRKRVASGLIMELQKFMSYTGERYPVNARFPVTEEDVSLHRFFLSLPGVEVSYSHERFFVTSEDVKRSKPIHRGTPGNAKLEKFFDAREDYQKRMLNSLMRTYGYAIVDYEDFKEDCVPELCLYLNLQNNPVCGIFVQRSAEHEMELSWLYGKYPPGLFQILEKAAQEAERLFPKDGLTFEAINEKSEQLAERLFPGARSIQIYEAEW